MTSLILHMHTHKEAYHKSKCKKWDDQRQHEPFMRYFQNILSIEMRMRIEKDFAIEMKRKGIFFVILNY